MYIRHWLGRIRSILTEVCQSAFSFLGVEGCSTYSCHRQGSIKRRENVHRNLRIGNRYNMNTMQSQPCRFVILRGKISKELLPEEKTDMVPSIRTEKDVLFALCISNDPPGGTIRP